MHVKTVAEENIQSRHTSLERVSDEVHFPLGARDAEYPLVVEAWKYTSSGHRMANVQTLAAAELRQRDSP